jgi:hypothetical protein
MSSNLTLKFAPFGRWDAPSARPLAPRYAVNPMLLNLIRLILLAAICMAQAGVSCAAEELPGVKYKPAFEVQLSANTSTVVAAYLHAYRSASREIAIRRWEAFLEEYATDDSIEDITDLTLIRQANFELMRLYYQNGKIVEADKLLKKSDEYAAFSLPEPEKARMWCRENQYCEK